MIGAAIPLLVAFALLAGCKSDGPTATSAPSAMPPLQTVDRPADALPIGALTGAKPGTRVKVLGWLWLFKPKCPACPPGRACEMCPLPYYQFSEIAHDGLSSASGPIVLVDFVATPPDLNIKTHYVLEGIVRPLPSTSGAHPLLVADRISALP